jgi:hypothetical protein
MFITTILTLALVAIFVVKPVGVVGQGLPPTSASLVLLWTPGYKCLSVVWLDHHPPNGKNVCKMWWYCITVMHRKKRVSLLECNARLTEHDVAFK